MNFLSVLNHHLRFLSYASLFVFLFPCSAHAQRGIGPDSVTVVAARRFAAGGFHRQMLGENYRDLWSMPIRVPVLHIDQIAGGLTPYKLGGGNQTVSLRMVASDSAEYVFRPVFKSGIRLPDDFRGTLVWWVFEDQWSASHPAANVAAVPMMNYFGILNPNARLAFMPDDPALGEYRKQFGGVLGTLEEYPTVPKSGRAFARAVEVMDAEELLAAINRDPSTQVDARKLLRVRMLDMLIGDNDRHADQWRWARLVKDGPFEPIARDRDKVFVSYNGTLLSLARHLQPALVKFDSVYSDPKALFENATNFDRRLLSGLDKSVWDSTARALQREITDSLIDATVAVMPREYASRSGEIALKLRERRARLPAAALLYYSELFKLADIHATDTADVAAVERRADGSVDVSIRFDGKAPWFRRHYEPADTREIRLYLHGGDDSAIVTGTAAASIPVRVIGGNGRNTLLDQSIVAGRSAQTKLSDVGTVTNVKYGRDTLLERESYVDALNAYYNRRPMVHAFGGDRLPEKDFGSSIKPVVGLKTGHGLGVVPKIGVARYTYGFRTEPYSSMVQADAAYSTGTRGWKFNLLGDKRFASSDIHIPAIATMSELEVIQFRGFGNDVPDDDDPFFDVRQKQWSFKPALGFTFAPGSDITFGPTVRYTTTDSARSGFLSLTQPYGFDKFAQVGAQLALHFESRVLPDTTKPRFIVDFIGSGYPGTWDVGSAYESIEGTAVGYMAIPLPNKPVIALRAGGKKLYGAFPFFDAAFLGGGSSFRTEHRQRFAGDAAAFGSAELRVPLFKFPLITPTDVGLLGFADAGRVYTDGDSPGGWHTAAGGGFWVGAVKAATNVNVLFTNRSNRRVMVSLGFAY